MPRPRARRRPNLRRLRTCPRLRREPGGLIGGDSLAAAAERAALERLERSEQSEDVDPIEAEADRRVASRPQRRWSEPADRRGEAADVWSREPEAERGA